jgi:predicted RNA binding protein YcfA (HicA-like mRNA interferase family)
MVKKQSPLVRLKASKSTIKFAELVRILQSAGYTEQNIVGSHCVFGKTGQLPVLIVKPHGNKNTCLPKDVNRVIKILEAASISTL